MAERFDSEDRDWPARPWIMALVGAVGGLIVHFLTDRAHYDDPFPVWRQAATAFTVIATVSFILTVELRRWTWAIMFALGWGAVIALVGWFTAQYNQVPEIFEFPFFSGILAVLIAAPLFQTIRDEGAWRFPYARVHRHVWTDAVIGGAALLFTGITFLLAWLIASLFDVIGIDAIKELLKKEWFGWMLAGFAFGGAIGVLRERDALVATLQKLVTVILAVLAPVLAVALAAFLLSIPFTGLEGLWKSDIPATPMLLLSAAGAFVFLNDVIGDGGEERRPNIWLRRSALILAICILPLAFFAALSMGQRIGQYGWTPERIWGVIAVGVALAYGLAGWWSVFKGRMNFDEPLRPLQTKLAIGLCGLALFLALPIVDFGAISANSQLARLTSGKVKAEEFDWTAMAFDFGKSGRKHLAQIEKSGPANQRELAKTALASEDRYSFEQNTKKMAERAALDREVRIVSPDVELNEWLRSQLTNWNGCHGEPCAVIRLDGRTLAVLTPTTDNRHVAAQILEIPSKDSNRQDVPKAVDGQKLPRLADEAIAKSAIEVRPVQRRQVFIDGAPVGDAFE